MNKRINPELREHLDQFPGFDDYMNEAYLPAIRANSAGRKEPYTDPAVSMTDETITGPDGDALKWKIYRPKDSDETLPVLLWMHGGGFILGAYDESDGLCSDIVKAAGCVVVSVDYRLAPEHPYPAALEDCYTALTWIADHHEAMNIDRDRIGVAGVSAGGGLTAALALLARDRQYPSICFQMPLYPMIDDRNDTPSAHEISEGMVWNHKTNAFGWRMYLGALHDTDDVPAYAAPARAEDYSGLPYTYTCIGQLDPFRSETLTYVTKLAEAGVDVEFHLYPGAYHGFEQVAPEAAISKRAREEYIQAVKQAFARTET
ncbi:UNVERIFIED_CONTAM: alpha/beta hydrolase fold domain-containing protein [Halobacillus marinus]